MVRKDTGRLVTGTTGIFLRCRLEKRSRARARRLPKTASQAVLGFGKASVHVTGIFSRLTAFAPDETSGELAGSGRTSRPCSPFAVELLRKGRRPAWNLLNSWQAVLTPHSATHFDAPADLQNRGQAPYLQRSIRLPSPIHQEAFHDVASAKGHDTSHRMYSMFFKIVADMALRMQSLDSCRNLLLSKSGFTNRPRLG